MDFRNLWKTLNFLLPFPPIQTACARPEVAGGAGNWGNRPGLGSGPPPRDSRGEIFAAIRARYTAAA